MISRSEKFGTFVALGAFILAVAALAWIAVERLDEPVVHAPAATVTHLTSATPSAPPDLADQVAVAWSVATGWPESERWGFIFGFASVGDDLVVHTNLTEVTDLTEACGLLYQLNDPVLELDPPIDQVLVVDANGRVVWTCLVDAQVL